MRTNDGFNSRGTLGDHLFPMLRANGVDVVINVIPHAGKIRLHHLLRVDDDGSLAVAQIGQGTRSSAEEMRWRAKIVPRTTTSEAARAFMLIQKNSRESANLGDANLQT